MDENTKKHIQSKLALLPRKPGCYLMKDNTGKVIYVGKAKILKNRVVILEERKQVKQKHLFQIYQHLSI